nr:MAG TPA: hypothetical protein [Caudoviricetes sp.]
MYTQVHNSVHAGTQQCTRGYTIVYTRVHIPRLGSRYLPGESTPRAQIFRSRD